MNSLIKHALAKLSLATYISIQSVAGIFGQSSIEPLVWKKLESANLSRTSKVETFNFHRFQSFDSDKKTFELNKAKKVTLFAVYAAERPADLFIIKRGDHLLKVTNEAVVNRTTLEYVSTEEKPKILFYRDVLMGRKKDLKTDLSIGYDELLQTDKNAGVAEIMVFDKILEYKDKQKWQSYFALKYGIPLPDTTMYVDGQSMPIWKANNEGKYNKGLAFIGRDDDTKLYQRQSRNAYDDARISFSLGKLSSINDENSSIITNGQYLLMSHDGGKISFSKNDNEDWRFERTWKWASKGSFQDVFFQIHKDDLDLLQENNQYELIIAGDSESLFNTTPINRILLQLNENEYYESVQGINLRDNESVYIGIQARSKAPIKPIVSEIVSIQPNPALAGTDINVLWMQNEEIPKTLEIYNSAGALIQNISVDPSLQKSNVKILIPGTYEIKVNQGIKTQSQIIIVQ